MKTFLKMSGVAVLLAGMLAISGCGGGSDGSSTPEEDGTGPNTVTVTGAGTSNAATANNTYNIAAGNYTYTITGFGAGDKLACPAGSLTSLNNSNFTDGNIEITCTLGTVTLIQLTGLTVANDAAIATIDGPYGINTVLGADTVTP